MDAPGSVGFKKEVMSSNFVVELTRCSLKHVKCTFRYRKRKSSVSSTNGINGFGDHGVAHREDELLALGTSSGSIVIYSLKTGEVVKNFSADKAHPSRINDIVRMPSLRPEFAFNHQLTLVFRPGITRARKYSQPLMTVSSGV